MNTRAPGQRGQGQGSLPCGYDYARAPTIPVTQTRLLETQATLDRLLAGQPLEIDGREVPPLEVFGHLRSLVSLTLHVGQAEDLGPLQTEVETAFGSHVNRRSEARQQKPAGRRGTSLHPYKAAPTDPLLMAATLPLALDILTAPGRTERAERLAGLMARAREVKRGQAWQLADYFHFGGPVLEACGAHLTANAQAPRRLGRHAHDRQTYSFTPDHVPAQLWPGVYHERFAPFFAGSDLKETSARRFISMMLVQLVTPLDRAGAAQVLGLPSSHAGGLYNKAAGVVRASGDLQAFDEALKAFAGELSDREDRVDYGTRRQALATFTEVAREAWLRVDPRVGTRSEARRRNAAAWIWAHLTLGGAEMSPALNTGVQSPNAVELYGRFVRWVEPDHRPALEQLAGRVLAQAVAPG